MPRGDTSLASYDYDNHLAQKSKYSRSARQELTSRKLDRRNAHDSHGVGYHFGLSDAPVKIERKEDLRKVLDSHGLMLATDVKKDLRKIDPNVKGR